MSEFFNVILILWIKTKLKTFLSKAKVGKYLDNVQPKIEHVFHKELEKE